MRTLRGIVLRGIVLRIIVLRGIVLRRTVLRGIVLRGGVVVAVSPATFVLGTFMFPRAHDTHKRGH